MSVIRARFAPSPSGYLHIGSARTALFNFLFARHCAGVFVLRIDDTDRERSTPESIRAIIESLSWLGLAWDEGPVFQSHRTALYRERANGLLRVGLAYRCTCPPEELDRKRRAAIAAGRKPMYDGTCRELALTAAASKPFVIRFRSPRQGTTVVEDVVKGRVVFDNQELDDLVMVRSDGTPTYNFCSVVDDSEMGITHIIRGDDHLPNTPRQVLLFQALGLATPRFAHIPLILGTDRARLSKRHGAVSVTSYRDDGYLPEAMVNYLARLGWSLGDQEIFSLSELIDAFTLEDVGKAAGIFNPEKLLWLNSHHLRERSASDLVTLLPPFMRGAGYSEPQDISWLAEVVEILKPRAKTLAEMVAMARYLLMEEIELDPKAATKLLTAAIAPALSALADRIAPLDDWNRDSLHAAFEAVVTERGLSLGKLAQPVRVAVTGGTASPGIFEVLELLGKDRAMRRLTKAIARAESTPAA